MFHFPREKIVSSCARSTPPAARQHRSHHGLKITIPREKEGDIVVPVQEEGQDLVIGVIGAILDISDLFPLVSGVKIGSTGETLLVLVKEDGTIISGAEMPSALQEKLLYFEDRKSVV